MDGENNGKRCYFMDDLQGKPTIFGNTHMDHPKNQINKTGYFLSPSPNWTPRLSASPICYQDLPKPKFSPRPSSGPFKKMSPLWVWDGFWILTVCKFIGNMYQINWLPGFLSINTTESYDEEYIIEIRHHSPLKSCKGIPKRNDPNFLSGLF